MFNSISSMRPKLNRFDLTHEKKLSCNMGQLVPIMLEEVVPGDRFRVNSEIMMRLAPMLAPVMHRVNVFTHFFFVPNRLVWNEWEDFITGGEDGLQMPVAPYLTTTAMQAIGQMSVGTLADYMGIPPILDVPVFDQQINALPFRAYCEIYNEYYRDQNLQTKIPFAKTSGSADGDVSALLALRVRPWEKDYFTSALPWAQRGNPISIPGTPNYLDVSEIHNPPGFGGGLVSAGRSIGVHAIDAGELATAPSGGATSWTDKAQLQNLEDIGIDINDLRRSNALQKWLELAARGGSRYIEQIRNFFGITSSDARLQRPEYLGGGKQNVMISEVLQTTQTEETGTPQGNMAGHGISVGTTNSFKKGPFEEHGFVMGIMSVLPRTAYQDGIHRMWSRMDKFDYYFPQFAHLGEQAILGKEIYYDGQADDNEATWGYQARYAEYKHRSSQVAGDFRSNLAYWHMGRIFSERPGLDSLFIQSNPTHRIFANEATEDHKLWVQILHRISALRPMPYYGTPRL